MLRKDSKIAFRRASVRVWMSTNLSNGMRAISVNYSFVEVDHYFSPFLLTSWNKHGAAPVVLDK